MATRQADRLDAWILGSGIASLTAAVHLIQEAQVPPSRIHIIETLNVAGGTTISYGNAESGYDFRASILPPFNDVCMETLLSLVPSLSDPNRTVRDEIFDFAEPETVRAPRTRFLTRKPNGVGRLDGKKMQLGMRDRIDLFMLASKSEKALRRARICDFFHQSFFHSTYWLTLATTFSLKPSHSAVEFRRYLHRFHDLHDLNNPHILDLGQYNVHESIMVPIAHFLQTRGVDFRFSTTISDIIFAYDNPEDPNEPTRVRAIQTSPARGRSATISSREEKTIQLNQDDIVIVTLGSVLSSILTGDNTRSPPFLERLTTNFDFESGADPIDPWLDENWLLWLELCTKHRKFGNACNFCTRLHESRLESFTITLSSPEFFERLTATTGDEPGPTTTLTLRDSAWLITLRIPGQPVFPGQPSHTQVCWGYALHPEKEGDYVKEPMLDCSGEKILTEILHHLHFEPESILNNAITIPCIQPRAAATLLPRTPEDRPQVIPWGTSNIAVIGPFVEIPDEVVVTTDYSVRGAQMAVRKLMGVDREVRKSKKASAVHMFGLHVL